VGGAHRHRGDTIASVGKAIAGMLQDLSGKSPEDLISDRRRKFLDIGAKGLAA
jgi:acetyl-CoA carboxylase carboxyl transferase subunit alpha